MITSVCPVLIKTDTLLPLKDALQHKFPQNLWTYCYIKTSQCHLLVAIENSLLGPPIIFSLVQEVEFFGFKMFLTNIWPYWKINIITLYLETTPKMSKRTKMTKQGLRNSTGSRLKTKLEYNTFQGYANFEIVFIPLDTTS